MNKFLRFTMTLPSDFPALSVFNAFFQLLIVLLLCFMLLIVILHIIDLILSIIGYFKTFKVLSKKGDKYE